MILRCKDTTNFAHTQIKVPFLCIFVFYNGLMSQKTHKKKSTLSFLSSLNPKPSSPKPPHRASPAGLHSDGMTHGKNKDSCNKSSMEPIKKLHDTLGIVGTLPYKLCQVCQLCHCKKLLCSLRRNCIPTPLILHFCCIFATLLPNANL